MRVPALLSSPFRQSVPSRNCPPPCPLARTHRHAYVIRTFSSLSADDGVLEVDTLISLCCPLALERIEIPAKGKDCNHKRCFDLEVCQQSPPTLVAPLLQSALRLSFEEKFVGSMKQRGNTERRTFVFDVCAAPLQTFLNYSDTADVWQCPLCLVPLSFQVPFPPPSARLWP